MTVPKGVRFVHAWTGAILSLLLILISLSGVLLVWKEDYISLVFSDAAGPFARNVAATARIAAAAETAFGDAAIARVDFGTPPRHSQVRSKTGH